MSGVRISGTGLSSGRPDFVSASTSTSLPAGSSGSASGSVKCRVSRLIGVQCHLRGSARSYLENMSKLSRTLGNSIAHRGILPRSITSCQAEALPEPHLLHVTIEMEFERRWWGSFPTGSIARHVKPISQERHRADVLRGNPVPGGFFPSFFIVVLALLASGTSLAQDQKDREFQECPECPIMVGIPSGTFSMGSPPTESGSFDSEGPQHAPTSRHMGTREPRRR